MNYSQILKRAWTILWSYRALWIFGFFIALATPSVQNLSNNVNYQFNERDLFHQNVPAEIRRGLDELNHLFDITWGPEEGRMVITIIILVVLFLVLLGVGFAVLRYISMVALISMVDEHEATGEKVGWREGFRLGWSREAWRLFLVDLVIYLPLTLVFLLLFGCALTPVIIFDNYGDMLTWTGIVATIGLFFLLIFLSLLVVLVLSLFMKIIYNVVVLQRTGVREGIKLGWQMVRRNFKDVFLMWLILVGLQIGTAIVLIPVVLVLVAIGAVVGGSAGFGMYHLANNLWDQAAGWVSAVLLGISLFILVLAVPLSFLNGLKETYISTVWTLAYRTFKQPAALVEALSSAGSVQPEA